MIYAVCNFLDQIKLRKDRHPAPYCNYHTYFDSEEEAKTFLRQRALEKLHAAQEAHKAAARRFTKVERKFAAGESQK